jgi:hypothetical protein
MNDPYNLSLTAMPIIRLMKDGGLSWAQHEECARALQRVLSMHESLMRERHEQLQAECRGQAPAIATQEGE